MSATYGNAPMTRNAIRLAAQRATTASELAFLCRALAPGHGPKIAAGIVGENWRLLSGKKTADRMLDSLIERTAAAEGIDRATACRRVGDALMNPAERVAFHELTHGAGNLAMFRFTDLTRTTGWHPSREAARAQWDHAKPPLAVESVPVVPGDVLAVKFLRGQAEAVLVPDAARLTDRRFLR